MKADEVMKLFIVGLSVIAWVGVATVVVVMSENPEKDLLHKVGNSILKNNEKPDKFGMYVNYKDYWGNELDIIKWEHELILRSAGKDGDFEGRKDNVRVVIDF